MRIPKCIAALIVVLSLFVPVVVSGAQQTSPKEGKLVVRVFIGDNNAPACDSFVYVHGYRYQDNGEVSVAPSPAHEGWFEISLQSGLYDIFVTEESSLPMCRRVEVVAGHTRFYTAKLEADDDHLQN
jgi:hypothetical protein